MIKRPPLAFTANPLDRGGNNRADSGWLYAAGARGDARYMAFRKGQILLQNSHILWLHSDDASVLPGDDEAVFLGLSGGAPRFALDLADGAQPTEGAFEDVRMTAHKLPPEEAGMIAQALSVLEWRARHAHCAVCGAATKQDEGGGKRVCVHCEAEHFARVDPVVIMWITRGDQALLGRQGYWPGGVYSALAGFIEPGETIEAACRRETMEEAGVEIGDVRYVESQPWPFPSSLMIGLHADALGAEIRIDTRELEDARWFSRDVVAAALEGRSDELNVPPSAAIARRLAERWVAGELDQPSTG